MSAKTSTRGSARERLLTAASELFYEEGVHTVGVDRVIERAGVAKASLYSTFGSKDGLVRAYLDARHESTRARLNAELARHDSPRDRLVGIFEMQQRRCADPDYRGCPFVRASAESEPGSAVEAASDAHREWMHSVFRELSAEAGAADPDELARALGVLYDGAVLATWMDRDSAAAAAAVRTARMLVDAAVA